MEVGVRVDFTVAEVVVVEVVEVVVMADGRLVAEEAEVVLITNRHKDTEDNPNTCYDQRS